MPDQTRIFAFPVSVRVHPDPAMSIDPLCIERVAPLRKDTQEFERNREPVPEIEIPERVMPVDTYGHGGSTVILRTILPIFPAASRARNVSVLVPIERAGLNILQFHDPLDDTVVLQSNVPPVPPLLISRVAPLSADPEKVGVVVVNDPGVARVGARGAIVSTTNVPLAVDPEFHAISFAVTMMVWIPSERLKLLTILYDPDCTIPLPRNTPPLLYMTTCAIPVPPLQEKRGLLVFILFTGDVILTVPVPIAIQVDPHQLYPLPQANVQVDRDHVVLYVQLALVGE